MNPIRFDEPFRQSDVAKAREAMFAPQELPRPPRYVSWTAALGFVLVLIAIAGTIAFPHA